MTAAHRVAHLATVAETAIAESATRSLVSTACGRVVKSTTVVKTTTVVNSTTPSKPLASPFEGLATKAASACRHGRADVAPRLSRRRVEGWDSLNHPANLDATLAVLEHNLGANAINGVRPVQNLYTPYRSGTGVTESVTVTKSGTVTESVTGSVTEGARAKAALSGCRAAVHSDDRTSILGNSKDRPVCADGVDPRVDGPVDAGVVGLRASVSRPHANSATWRNSMILQGSLTDASRNVQGMHEQCSGHPTRRVS